MIGIALLIALWLLTYAIARLIGRFDRSEPAPEQTLVEPTCSTHEAAVQRQPIIPFDRIRDRWPERARLAAARGTRRLDAPRQSDGVNATIPDKRETGRRDGHGSGRHDETSANPCETAGAGLRDTAPADRSCRRRLGAGAMFGEETRAMNRFLNWLLRRKPSTPSVAAPAPSNDEAHPFLRCTKIDGGFACTRPPEDDQ